MCVLDDICATMHAVTEGADQTLVQVSEEMAMQSYFKPGVRV